MANISRVLAVLIAFVALTPHSYSQTTYGVLEGVKGVTIDVNLDIGNGAAACGVTKERLRTAASFPVATSPLTLTQPGVFFQVEVFVLRADAVGCAASFNVRVLAVQPLTLEESGLRNIYSIVLWETAGILLGPFSGFESQVREAIEGNAKAFVVDWTLDQQ